jgi:hypothetical protein
LAETLAALDAAGRAPLSVIIVGADFSTMDRLDGDGAVPCPPARDIGQFVGGQSGVAGPARRVLPLCRLPSASLNIH